MKKKYIFILALSAAFSLTLAAQDKDAPEKRVVDTGASRPLSLEETTSAVSVITSEDISRRNSKNVGGSMLGQGLGQLRDDLLGRVSGSAGLLPVIGP